MYQQPASYNQTPYGGGYGQYPQGGMSTGMNNGIPGGMSTGMGGMPSGMGGMPTGMGGMPSGMGGMSSGGGMPYSGTPVSSAQYGGGAPNGYGSQPSYPGAASYGQAPSGYGAPNGGGYMGQPGMGQPGMGGQGGYGAPQGYSPHVQRPGSTDSTKYKLQKIFNGVDKDGDGRLSEEELRGALINGDYTKFNPETVKLMIKMFDRNGDKSIDFEEFGYLWKYLADWRKLFARFDQDKNDTISFPEFDDAMKAFGYTLSPGFVQNLFAQYSHTNRKTHQRVISFDMFVQCCITVKRMTEAFKQFDTDRDGIVTLEFEQFLTTVMKLR